MDANNWIEEFPAAITVCDTTGTIVGMNAKASRGYAKSGGRELIGKNLLDCHPEPARSKVANMLEQPQINCYTIEKQGIKKLIYQSPWCEEGIYKGFVEISMELPSDIPHFVRK